MAYFKVSLVRKEIPLLLPSLNLPLTMEMQHHYKTIGSRNYLVHYLGHFTVQSLEAGFRLRQRTVPGHQSAFISRRAGELSAGCFGAGSPRLHYRRGRPLGCRRLDMRRLLGHERMFAR